MGSVTRTVFCAMIMGCLGTAVSGCSSKIYLRDPITGKTAVCERSAADVMGMMGFSDGAERCAAFYEQYFGFQRY